MWITVIFVDSSPKQQNSRFQNFWYLLHCYVFLSQWDIRKRRMGVSCNRLFLQIQETSLEVDVRYVINRFVRTGSVNKGKSSGRLSVSEGVVDKIVSAVRSSCCSMKLNNGTKALMKGCYKTFLKLKREWTCALSKMVNIFNTVPMLFDHNELVYCTFYFLIT